MDSNVYWCPSDGSTIQYGPVIGFDCETNARETRDPFQHVYVTAVDDGSGNAVHVLDDARRAAFVLNGVQQLGARIVGHNASGFDRLQLKRATGIDLKCDDTMLMAFLLHEEWGPAKMLNLQALCVHYLKVPPWKDDVTWNWRDAATIPWDDAKQYCARDTSYTRALYLTLEAELKADPLLWQLYDRLLLLASRALSDMEERGLYIVDENVQQARGQLDMDINKHGAVVQDVSAEQGLPALNPRSPKQVGQLLFDLMGFPVVETTTGGARSTAVGTLKTLRERFPDQPIFPAMLGIRKAEKLDTYLDRFEKERDRYGMSYPWYSLVLTATGRTSGNYQQIPRDKRIRRCIGAPPGKVFIQADFSQLEMRIAASKYVFDEPNLRAAFQRGDDVHRLLAAEIHNKPPQDVTKEERQDAKPANFLFLYGGEEDMYLRTIFEDSDIIKTRAQATIERDAFFTRWSGLPAGHTRTIEEVKATGQVRSFTGAIRRLPEARPEYQRWVRLAAYRQAVNAVVQTPTCHLALIGLVLLGAAGFDVRSFQHDAYLLWLDDDEGAVRAATAQIRYLLETGVPAVLRSEFGIDFDVPLKVDITAGTAWTDDDRQSWVA